MKKILVRFPIEDLPDYIVKKLICIDDVCKCFNKSGRKIFNKNFDNLLGKKLLNAYCEFIDNLYSELGLTADMFKENVDPCVLCAGIRELGEKQCQK